MNRNWLDSMVRGEVPLGRILNRRAWLRGAAALAGVGLVGRWGVGADQTGASSRLRLHTQVPHNAETAPQVLLNQWITPVADFYVRSHAPNPEIDLAAYRVTVDGLVDKPLTLTPAELSERFPAAKVTATLCCAGNRRDEHSRFKHVEGVQWGVGAIGNAEWGGIRLRDLLAHAGLKPEAKYVWFEGLDRHEKQGKSIVFGGSVSLDRILTDDAAAETLVALTMNGAPLTADHGAPVRTIVPGYIGARSVKWLSRITVSDRPSDNYYLADAYRFVTADTPEAKAQAPALYELPLQSVICQAALEPGNNQRQRLVVRGYALPSGALGETLQRVEVSADGGETWRAATLDGKSQPYCWQFWRAELRVGRTPPTRVLVRAIGSDWRMQPERPEWNVGGYMYNGWHGVDL